MKRAVSLVFLLSLLSAPGIFAQDHAEVGVFGELFRWDAASTNLAGVGGRVSVNVAPIVQLEAETSYDFEQSFTEGFKDPTTGSVTLSTSNLRAVHGMIGPKLQTNKGPVRLFVTAKGGAMAFMFSHAPATLGTFGSTINNLRGSDLNAVFYPGGGAEAYLGPIGLRFDIGDEIYFAGGAQSNLRITFGPTIRF
jgi:hypothetical protein